MTEQYANGGYVTTVQWNPIIHNDFIIPTEEYERLKSPVSTERLANLLQLIAASEPASFNVVINASKENK